MHRDDSLHRRLVNWARWSRYAPDAAVPSRSLEANYRSPANEDDARRKPGFTDPDADDAWEIELATRGVALKYHFMLWLVYVQQYDPQEVSKAFRMSKLPRVDRRVGRRDVLAMTAHAQALLAAQLRFPAVVRNAHAAAWVRAQLPLIVETGVEAAP